MNSDTHLALEVEKNKAKTLYDAAQLYIATYVRAQTNPTAAEEAKVMAAILAAIRKYESVYGDET